MEGGRERGKEGRAEKAGAFDLSLSEGVGKELFLVEERNHSKGP